MFGDEGQVHGLDCGDGLMGAHLPQLTRPCTLRTYSCLWVGLASGTGFLWVLTSAFENCTVVGRRGKKMRWGRESPQVAF